MNEAEFAELYPRLAHAMQSGVAATISLEGETSATSPKHLRTGVNMALVEQGSITQLLIEKGLITKEELRQALVDGLRKEVARYEADLSKTMGRPVTLG